MITGERVRLRALEKSDIPRFVEWFNDPEVIRHIATDTPISTLHEEAWFENMVKRDIEEQPLMIEIKTPDNWKPIGDIGLLHLDWKSRNAEVGIAIGDKAEWDKGYGREAMLLMLRQAFDVYNLHRVYLRVNATNLRGIQSYTRAGFKEEGRLREAYFQDGNYIDMLIMSILQNEWQGRDK